MNNVDFSWTVTVSKSDNQLP